MRRLLIALSEKLLFLPYSITLFIESSGTVISCSCSPKDLTSAPANTSFSDKRSITTPCTNSSIVMFCSCSGVIFDIPVSFPTNSNSSFSQFLKFLFCAADVNDSPLSPMAVAKASSLMYVSTSASEAPSSRIFSIIFPYSTLLITC